MANAPLVFVIGTIKMLAQAGMTAKIVDVCNEWLDEFVSSPTPDAADLPKAGENFKPCPLCGTLLPVQDLPDTGKPLI